MDISSYSLFLFIITTLLYVSSVPIIGKPPLILINNNGNFGNFSTNIFLEIPAIKQRNIRNREIILKAKILE